MTDWFSYLSCHFDLIVLIWYDDLRQQICAKLYIAHDYIKYSRHIIGRDDFIAVITKELQFIITDWDDLCPVTTKLDYVQTQSNS